jgi:predicted negative regulator of RcsB-dependent stress response
VDDYISEKEQIERIKDWWKENGWYLIGGVAIGLVGLFGYGRYQDYANSQAEDAQVLYEQVAAAVADDDLAALDTALAALRSAHGGSPYADHAGFLAARYLLVRDSERAAAELRLVLQNTSDPELAMIARMRLARVLAYREQYDSALETLDVDEPGEFAGRLNEIRGDIYVAEGNLDAARAAFSAALVAEGADFLNREFVQMKLSDLLGTANPSNSGDDG